MIRRMGLMVLWMMVGGSAMANQTYYRSFWNPMYYGERLAYCAKDDTHCNKPIALRYCQAMGYKTLKRSEVAYNVGRTHYMDQEGECTGWGCDGFKLIECEGALVKDKTQSYLYRKNRFAYPRIENHRVDYCATKQGECGYKAAYSFCRRMGYEDAVSYKIDKSIQATRRVRDQSLCYGNQCKGFETIVCRR